MNSKHETTLATKVLITLLVGLAAYVALYCVIPFPWTWRTVPDPPKTWLSDRYAEVFFPAQYLDSLRNPKRKITARFVRIEPRSVGRNGVRVKNKLWSISPRYSPKWEPVIATLRPGDALEVTFQQQPSLGKVGYDHWITNLKVLPRDTSVSGDSIPRPN